MPLDYGDAANTLIRPSLGLVDADFEAMRRPYDAPRRATSKRALFEVVRAAFAKSGAWLYGADRPAQ